jgi:hypothetical protein
MITVTLPGGEVIKNIVSPEYIKKIHSLLTQTSGLYYDHSFFMSSVITHGRRGEFKRFGNDVIKSIEEREKEEEEEEREEEGGGGGGEDKGKKKNNRKGIERVEKVRLYCPGANNKVEKEVTRLHLLMGSYLDEMTKAIEEKREEAENMLKIVDPDGSIVRFPFPFASPPRIPLSPVVSPSVITAYYMSRFDWVDVCWWGN